MFFGSRLFGYGFLLGRLFRCGFLLGCFLGSFLAHSLLARSLLARSLFRWRCFLGRRLLSCCRFPLQPSWPASLSY